MFTTVLLVSQPLTATDVDFVTSLHEDQVSFVVLTLPNGAEKQLLGAFDDTPLEEGAAGSTGEGEAALRPAALALEQSIRALRDTGAEATGRVIDGHPLELLRAVVEETGADELVVLIGDDLVEEFFKRDWAARARTKVGVPAVKVHAHNGEE
ncbi:indole-3-glycerol phosphate synthase [Streptomyces sp. YS415]|uniref:indole-3-glycerol phosphate synthase n=1 Tax=Streptomyces sp. YS415 TaxID=2944806 RepID=UPI00201FDFCD|nr:indole-3-glycerol phosphate synthase [Streptomyces sp. YS415]MCL7430398.1 indole-3-glycerol phosphate synthase [Streptomyces sp. YS415]